MARQPDRGGTFVSDLAQRIDRQRNAFVRRGVYVLLPLALVLSLTTANLFGNAHVLPYMAAISAALAVAHWFCVDRRWGKRLDDPLGRIYVAARTAAALLLTVFNPFFSVFAFVGYFDAQLYGGRRQQTAVVIATAIIMAGSQSGGFPPRSGLQALAFAGLLTLNFGLVWFFRRLADQEEELLSERDTTIVELERVNAKLSAALAENENLQAQLLQRAHEAGVHEERERLALEIHDTLAQSLIGIVTQLQAADDAGDAAAVQRHRQRAAELAREALREARRSVQGLLPHRLDDATLPDALERLRADWSTATGVAADFVVDGVPAPLHRDVESTVLRVAQEALTNVDKHARAARVGIALSYMDDVLTLDIRDDGCGFDALDRGSGVGLPGMRQRAARVAGALIVESEPGAGTAVSLHIPKAADV